MSQQKFRAFTQVFLVGVLTISGVVFLGNPTGNAEVVEVEGQGDCPGGNDGWRRGIVVDIASKRTFTRCVHNFEELHSLQTISNRSPS